MKQFKGIKRVLVVCQNIQEYRKLRERNVANHDGTTMGNDFMIKGLHFRWVSNGAVLRSANPKDSMVLLLGDKKKGRKKLKREGCDCEVVTIADLVKYGVLKGIKK